MQEEELKVDKIGSRRLHISHAQTEVLQGTYYITVGRAMLLILHKQFHTR